MRVYKDVQGVEFPKTRGSFLILGVLHNMDYCVLRSMVGSPY